jgi:hypothetical protein
VLSSGVAASPFIEAKVLLPLIDLGKGLPQAWPRRATAVPLLLSMDTIHGVKKRQSTGVVQEGLTSSPDVMHHPPQSLQESRNQRTTICRHVRGYRFPVKAAWTMWSACCYPCFLSCLIVPQSVGVHMEGLSWSSSSRGTSHEERFVYSASKCCSPHEAPPHEGLLY